jgi:hypothetical protein
MFNYMLKTLITFKTEKNKLFLLNQNCKHKLISNSVIIVYLYLYISIQKQ